MTQPVRISPDLFESARRVGESQERSTAQQLSHWARIGREIENSSTLSVAGFGRLADAATYDQLDPATQALVRASWEEGVQSRIAGLDLRALFAEQGRSEAVVGDVDGHVHTEAVNRPARAERKKAPAKRVSR
mgnify:CR=1 FL=1